MRQPLTRDAISKAARDILVTEGLHSVSLRRVASSLGVTAPALYAHVVDKRDLLQGIVEQEIDGLVRSFTDARGGDAEQTLRRQCEIYVDYALHNPDLFRAMFLFRPELTAEPRADDPALGNRLFDAFRETVDKARDNGVIADGDPSLAALTVWSALHGVAVMLLSGPPLPIELKGDLSNAAITTVLTGLRNGALVPAA